MEKEDRILYAIIKSTLFKICIGFTLYLLFQESINNLLRIYIGKPILGAIDTSQRVDLLFLFLFTLIYLVFAHQLNSNYQVSRPRLNLVLFISIIYTKNRIFDSQYLNFERFFYFPNLYYSDLLFFILFGFVILFANNLIKNSREIVIDNSGFIFDEPLKTENDLLGRVNYAKALVDKIIRSNGATSLAIGITGIWGSGKTSFLNVIENHFHSQNQIIIKFNPWRAARPKAISEQFFDLLGSELDYYGSKAKREVESYTKELIRIQETVSSKIANFVFDKISPDQTIDAKFEAINSLLKKIGKKVIIFIDDIDRLSNDEILEVIQLIRNSANFQNAVFIVAYDREYIRAAIEKTNSYKSDKYIEKIIQVELSLPLIPNNQILNTLEKLLITRLDPLYHQEIKEIIFGNGPTTPTILNEYFVTHRDVNRFVNSFHFNFDIISDDVVLENFFYIEMLKLKYPEVVHALRRSPEKFFEVNSRNLLNARYETKSGDIAAKRTSTFDELKSELKSLTDNDENIVYPVLERLFPSGILYAYQLTENAIYYPYSFERYFSYTLNEGAISNKEFKGFIRSEYPKMEKQISIWVNSGFRGELNRKLNELKTFESKNDFEKIIRAIFFFARIPLNPNIKNDFSGYNDENIFEKLTHDRTIKLFYPNPNDFKTFLFTLFREYSAPPYSSEADFLNFCNNRLNTSHFTLTLAERIKLLLFYLTDYVFKHGIDDRAIFLFWKTKYRIPKKEGTIEYRVPQRAKTIFIDWLKTGNLKTFISYTTFIEYYQNNSFYLIGDIVFQIWGNATEWLRTLQSMEQRYGNDDFYIEYITFVELFIRNGLKSTEFSFDHNQIFQRGR